MPKDVRGARRCNSCGTVKRAERFYPSNPYRCKKCFRDATRAHRREHPEIWTTYKRKHTLKRLYGITPEDYRALLDRQGGRCAICRADHVHRRGINNFAVDHDHETGLVRGLLCHNCNRGLGHFKDDAGVLESAIAYLSAREARSA